MEMETSNSRFGLGLCTGPGQARQEAAGQKYKNKNLTVGDGRNSRGEEENQR